MKQYQSGSDTQVELKNFVIYTADAEQCQEEKTKTRSHKAHSDTMTMTESAGYDTYRQNATRSTTKTSSSLPIPQHLSQQPQEGRQEKMQ